jgi:hypothetical protein
VSGLEPAITTLVAARLAPRQKPRPLADPVARLLALPLDRYAREGQPLEIRVSWLDRTLWFVPDERHAEGLAAEGIGRGRIWTAAELAQLLAIPARTPADVRALAIAKAEFDGDLLPPEHR